MSKYTKENLLSLLLQLAEKIQRKPTKHDLREYNLPSAGVFRYHGISLGGTWIQEYLHSLANKVCPECNEPIKFVKSNNSFCSQSCRASNLNRLRDRRENHCLHCGEIFHAKSENSKYCSRDCMFTFQFISKFRDWYEFGRMFENDTLRGFLTVWKGYVCEHCGISDWNGKEITLEVEHIDGNSENSSPSNVCLLCPNCHSQTPTYKAKNIGNGRHSRRIRYQEGKSY